MRDIKFRAWIPEKQWGGEGGGMIEDYTGTYDFLTWGFFSADKGIAYMQFTGLTDKNGKDIYEGDIYTQGDKDIKYKVIFVDGQFVGNQIGNKSLAGLCHWIDRIEVIGNIYENPELLEATQ